MNKNEIKEMVKNNINSMPYCDDDYDKMADEISTKIDAPKSMVMTILKGLNISRLFHKNGYIYEVATLMHGRRGILVDGHVDTIRNLFIENSEYDVVLMDNNVAEILGYDNACLVR